MTEDKLIPAIARDNFAGIARNQDVADYDNAVRTLQEIAHEIRALFSAPQEADLSSVLDAASNIEVEFRNSPSLSDTREVLSDFVGKLRYEVWLVVTHCGHACGKDPPDLPVICRCADMAEVIVRCAERMQCIVNPMWSPAEDMNRQGRRAPAGTRPGISRLATQGDGLCQECRRNHG